MAKTAKKPAAKKPAAKKATAKKPEAKKKLVTKKAAPKKVVAKKAPAKKPAAKKKVASKANIKKTVAKKSTVNKALAKPSTAKKKTTKPVATKKSAAKNASSKNTAKVSTMPQKKTPAKKVAAAKKPAVTKKAAPKKAATKKASDAVAAETKVVPIKPYKPVKLPKGYKPSAKEEYMNAQQMEYFRQKLFAWRNELLEESRETLDHLHEENWHQADIADRASLETEASVELRTRNRYLKLISKIDAAVRRVETGEYGYCEETGEEIGIKRLEARPVATLSIEAQERHERMEKQFTDDD